MNIGYRIVQLFCMFVCKIYYREVEVINGQNVPKEGPVIVFANHNNCYIDGAVLASIIPRQVSLLTAAVTYRCSPFLSVILNLIGAIPLERSWDVAYEGKGVIKTIKEGIVKGQGTSFKECKVGDIFEFIKGKEFKIISIESDVQIKIKSHQYQFEGQQHYRIIPKLSYQHTYNQVWAALHNQRCIAIFPEGDTHDKIQLLPLKVGICIAALGAIEKYGKPVTLVPCGMSFQSQHVFRSKMTVEFGQAFSVPQHIVDLYKTNKHSAINALFQMINKMLKDITFEFKHYQEYDSLKTIHSIFEATTKDALTPTQRMQSLRHITKSFSNNLKSGPPNFKNKVRKALSLSAKTKLQLPNLQIVSKTQMFNGVFLAVFIMAVTFFLMIPGFFLYYVASYFVAHFAEEQRKSSFEYTKSRNSRLRANDVVSSYMGLHAVWIMPISLLINSTFLFICLVYYVQYSTFESLLICLGCLLAQPLYALLFVRLVDAWRSSLQKLRKCAAYIFNRPVVMDMIELRRDIMSYTSFNLLGKRTESAHAHQQ